MIVYSRMRGTIGTAIWIVKNELRRISQMAFGKLRRLSKDGIPQASRSERDKGYEIHTEQRRLRASFMLATGTASKFSWKCSSALLYVSYCRDPKFSISDHHVNRRSRISARRSVV